MGMGEPILDVVVRSLPAIVSLVFSFFNFNRSLMTLGIEANRTLCRNYRTQEESGFLCLGPGANALSVTSAVISLATSLIIAAILATLSSTRVLYGIWAAVLFCGTLAYVASYRKEIFKVEEALTALGHTFWGNHIALAVNLITVACSIIFSVLSLS